MKSKVDAYDVTVKALFDLLDRTEESDSGRVFRPVQISCCREQVRLELESVLLQLKNIMKDNG